MSFFVLSPALVFVSIADIEGSAGRMPLRQALVSPLRYPALYAAAAGVVVNAAAVELPTSLAVSTAPPAPTGSWSDRSSPGAQPQPSASTASCGPPC